VRQGRGASYPSSVRRRLKYRCDNPAAFKGENSVSEDALKEKAEIIQTLNRRNTESVEAFLRKQDVVNADLNKRIDELRANITTAFHRIAELEQQIAIQRASSLGHGPTVR
jgi:DNA mismatch repair ATPase MutS